MDNLQRLSTGIVIAIAIFGSLGWLYNQFSQPDLNDGKYFESAWLDIKDGQLTLYVEFVPDGKGRGAYAAMEAVCRVKDKSWINSEIDGRPIVVVLMVRENTVLVPMAAAVIYDNGNVCDTSLNLDNAFRKAARNTTFLYNGTAVDIIDTTTGERISVNTSEFRDKSLSGNFLYATCSYIPVSFKYKECID